jgi:hypothetical protein
MMSDDTAFIPGNCVLVAVARHILSGDFRTVFSVAMYDGAQHQIASILGMNQTQIDSLKAELESWRKVEGIPDVPDLPNMVYYRRRFENG